LHYYSLKQDNPKQKRNSIALKGKADKKEEAYITEE
jgi:hypothetical protein